MPGHVIVVTKGSSLLMDTVEAGLRSRGAPVQRGDLQEVAPPRGPGAPTQGWIVIFDESELSREETARLREEMAARSGTLIGLSWESSVARRYRVDRVPLNGLQDLLDAATSGGAEPAGPGGAASAALSDFSKPMLPGPTTEKGR